MIRSLFVSHAGAEQARPPAGRRSPPQPIRKIAIIGAGFMGAGIADVSARAGIEVAAPRSRPGERRQGQGDRRGGLRQGRVARPAERGGQGGGARPHHAGRRFRRARRRRPRHRGGVRGPRHQGGRDPARRGGAAAGRDLRLQHLDAADHLARRGLGAAEEFHRHPFLLAGREDDAGRDHPRQEDRRRGARPRARLRPRHPQDADRRQRFARLLHLARRRHLYRRGPSHADRRRAGGDDRECRADGRHAGRPAGAQRRDGARPVAEDHERGAEGPWRARPCRKPSGG